MPLAAWAGVVATAWARAAGATLQRRPARAAARMFRVCASDISVVPGVCCGASCLPNPDRATGFMLHAAGEKLKATLAPVHELDAGGPSGPFARMADASRLS